MSWDERYGQLCAIRDAGGDVNVSKYDPDPVRRALGQWLADQRKAGRAGTLSAARFAKLDALGVRWGKSQDDVFAAHCAVLQEIKDAGGDVNVSSGKDFAEGTWLTNQRQAQKKGTLSPKRFAKLDALGVRWSEPRTP